ncbi:HEAT repeat domain-containing protein [Polyangium jinanense]|uniref:HEAT repeat domain-containing protein n=1 Tax=Polyangium jinanense TaxID=2829994 RepID=A0A9X4AQD7_9BACT|nr:HEAT repeat domain-containing protein [Polyangium jinanense]MDC3960359.1 HEAT repeat domain-containing protein [Polyangium jinanense]MDC3978980.1 HEAT repeat domain-containing protein [Polyangium jinanense]
MSTAPGSFTFSDAEKERIEEIRMLEAMGASGVPELVEMLVDPSWTVRRKVVAALAAMGDVAVEPLCVALRDRRDNEARIAAAVDALSASAGNADPAVLALADADAPAVLADAAQILGRRKSMLALPRLAELVSHPDDNVAVSSVEALGRIGGRRVVESLVRVVTGGNFFRTFPAIDVLGRSGDPRAVEPLADLLLDMRYMLEAARALGRTGNRAAVAPLVRLLARPGDAIVRSVALALAELRERHAELYGVVAPIDEALRRSVPVPATVRRFVQGLRGANQAEQVAICAVLAALGSEAAIPDLRPLLDGPSAVAAAAAGALLQLGQSSDARVLDALRDGDSPRRLLLLPLVTSRAAMAEVVRCLGDEDPEVRAAACDALGRIGDPSAVRVLFPLLADLNGRVVHAASSAIQSLGSTDTEALALEAARSERPAVRRAALRILGYFGYDAALPVFLDALGDPDTRVRDVAIAGLPYLDAPSALDALFALATGPDPRTRAAAVRALGQSTAEGRVVACLVDALGDADAWVRYFACKSLGRLGDEASAPRIAALLDDEAGHVRVGAVEALAYLRGEVAAAALQKAAEERDPDVQRAALIGLGLMGRPELVPHLVAGMASPDVATRIVAVSAIAGVPSPEVLPALVRAASDADESVAATAMGILAQRPGVEATRALVGLYAANPAAQRAFAALCAPLPGRIEGILESLATADDELAARLASALARMRRDSANEALLAALGLPNPAARKAAATTLAALGTRQAHAALEQAASVDPDPEVRRVCSLVVAQWGA